MFERFEEQKPQPRWYGPKLIAGGAAGLLLALGLCGAGAAWRGIEGVLPFLGLGVFFLSCVTLLRGVALFIGEFSISSFRGK